MTEIREKEENRRYYIGGSDAASILGVSPWRTPLQTYLQKTGEEVEEITPEKQKIFDRGKRFEPVVAEMLIEELTARGHDVEVISENDRYYDPKFEFLAAEIDLELVVDGKTINGEIKTVHPFAAKDWGEQHTDEIPIYYTAQVLHGQMVTNRDRTVVAALIGTDDLRIHIVERDEDLITVIRDKELAFWHMVQNHTPPPPINPEDIQRLFAHDNADPIQASPDIIEAVIALKDIKRKMKDLDAYRKNLESNIKLFMGEYATLLDDLAPLATWKSRTSSRLDTKQIKADDPEYYDKHKKEIITRTFLLK